MPLITVTLFEGRSPAQKKAFTQKIIAACKEELGSQSDQYIWVMFDEKKTDNWFAGEKSFTEIICERKPKQ